MACDEHKTTEVQKCAVQQEMKRDSSIDIERCDDHSVSVADKAVAAAACCVVTCCQFVNETPQSAAGMHFPKDKCTLKSTKDTFASLLPGRSKVSQLDLRSLE